MMRPLDDTLKEGLQAALRFAAMRPTFSPKDAINAASQALDVSLTRTQSVQLLSEIRASSQESGSEAPGEWSLRPGPRHKVLDDLAADRSAGAGDLGQSQAFEDSGSVDGLTPIDKALRGVGEYGSEAIDVVLGNLSDLPSAGDRARLQELTDVLDRAGAQAEGYDKLVRLRGALNLIDATERARAILDREFVGRAPELKRIADWIEDGQSDAPTRALFITGLPGIGKSFLLDRAMALYRRDAQRPIIIHLDFDRRSLNLEHEDDLVFEMSRQLGDMIPSKANELRHLRLKYAGMGEPNDSTSAGLPFELTDAMARAVTEAKTHVVVVLDTLEELRSQGDQRIRSLFALFDHLLRAGFGPMRVLAAGRGDALDPDKERIQGKPLSLSGLSEDEARELLSELDVDEEAVDDILAAAEEDDLPDSARVDPTVGRSHNPLMLRLAARSSKEPDFDPGSLAVGGKGALGAAYLYRAILSRIDDPRLAALAHPGLILRRINADCLRGILAPVILQESIEPAEADQLWRDLSSQHWLVVPDGVDWLKHETQLRRIILPVLYAEQSDLAGEIDRKARDWFAQNGDPETALYHAFQATRDRDPMPDFTAEQVSGFSQDDIEELPRDAAIRIRQALGQRSGADLDEASEADLETTASDPAQGMDPLAIQELEMTLEKGDALEAHVVFSGNAGFPTKPSGDQPEAPAIIAYYWLSGQWARAIALLQTVPQKRRQALYAEYSHFFSLVNDEIYAETAFADLVAHLRADDAFKERVFDNRRRGDRLALAGALDFALIAANSGLGKSSRSQADIPRDIVEARRSQGGLRGSSAARQGQDVAQRYGIVSDPEAANAEGMHHEVARLNPLAGRLGTLARIDHSPVMGRWLTGLYQGLDELLPLLGSGDRFDHYARYLDTAHEDGPEILGALGLTCDWACAFTLFHTVHDVPTLARAAERWRVTAMGSWPWPKESRPEGWREAGWAEYGETDPLLRRRLDCLMAQDDPIASARALLRRMAFAAFYPDLAEGRAHGARVFARRIAGHLDAVPEAVARDPMTIAAQLSPRMMGPAVTAAFAVLAAEMSTKQIGELLFGATTQQRS
ncbi:AAA family ATPase [Gymnodinialimonas sp.]